MLSRLDRAACNNATPSGQPRFVTRKGSSRMRMPPLESRRRLFRRVTSRTVLRVVEIPYRPSIPRPPYTIVDIHPSAVEGNAEQTTHGVDCAARRGHLDVPYESRRVVVVLDPFRVFAQVVQNPLHPLSSASSPEPSRFCSSFRATRISARALHSQTWASVRSCSLFHGSRVIASVLPGRSLVAGAQPTYAARHESESATAPARTVAWPAHSAQAPITARLVAASDLRSPVRECFARYRARTDRVVDAEDRTGAGVRWRVWAHDPRSSYI